MANKHIEEVLTAAGLQADQVKGLMELPDDAPDFKPDEYLGAVRGAIETQVKNDPAFYEGLDKANLPKPFLQKLEAEQYGRSAAMVRTNLLKAVGMTEKDFADLGEDGKKIDVFTPAFVKRISEGKVGDKELQAKLIEANTRLEQFEAERPELEQKYQTQADAKIAEYQQDSAISSALATVQGLNGSPRLLKPGITQALRAKYAIAIEEGEVVIRTKANPALKVLVGPAKNVELTLQAAVQEIAESEGAVVKKKTTTTTNEPITVGSENGKLSISKGVSDRMAKRMAQDAAGT